MTPNDDDRRAAVALFDDARTQLGLQNKLMNRDTYAVAIEAILAAERRGIERAAQVADEHACQHCAHISAAISAITTEGADK